MKKTIAAFALIAATVAAQAATKQLGCSPIDAKGGCTCWAEETEKAATTLHVTYHRNCPAPAAPAASQPPKPAKHVKPAASAASK